MAQAIERWRGGALKALAASLAYPFFLVLNRPSLAWFGRALYDIALRCNGIAINFPGRHGLTRGEERFLARIAPRLAGGVVLDIGANEGGYARYLAQLAPSARIIAFEPHPRTAARLRANIPGSVTVIEQAVGAEPGSVVLHDFADVDGSTQASLAPEAIRLFGGEVRSFDVTCTTIDAVLAERGIDHVAYMKVDTEGFDLAVLRGARQAIAEKRIAMIQFEFIPANIVTGATMRGFFDVLEGYDIHRICLNGALLPLAPYSVKHCEIFMTQNLVAIARRP